MVIAGAGGHARELAAICERLGLAADLTFFAEAGSASESVLLNRYPVLSAESALRERLQRDPAFALGTGRPSLRNHFMDLLTGMGGKAVSIIAPTAVLGTHAVEVGPGANIMDYAVVTESVRIGIGALIHVHASIHHDVVAGDYVEFSPGCRVLGRVQIGNRVVIGAGAVILPGIRIGNQAIIGAGAVVTRDVADGVTVKGVPAR